MMGFSTAGLSSAYPDVSPEYSGVIHATANSIGTLPAALGIFLIGWILEVSHNNWGIGMLEAVVHFSLFIYLILI
jgi:hypothetical protein